MAKARATARLTFPTNRRWAAERAKLEKRKKSSETGVASDQSRNRRGTGWGDGDGWAFSSDGSDSDSDDARPGAAFMALAGGQRVRGFGKRGGQTPAEDKRRGSESDGSDFGITLNEWDDEAPWAPWAALDDPWESVELDACWVDAPLSSLVDRDYIYLGGSGSEDEDSDEERGRERRDGKDLLEPEKAPLWTLRAVPTGAFREDGSGGMAGELSAAAKRFDLGAGIFSESSQTSNSFYDNKGDVDGGDDGPGGVGLAEMLWLFASAGGVRAAPGADTMSRLASPEYWDEVGSRYDREDGFGVGVPPRVPPESVVQDVLRDVFDTGGHGRDAGRRAKVTKETRGEGRRAKGPETDAKTDDDDDDEKDRARGSVPHAAEERAAGQSARQGGAARHAIRQRSRGRDPVAEVRARGSVRALGQGRASTPHGQLPLWRNRAGHTRVRHAPEAADDRRVHSQAQGQGGGGVCRERGFEFGPHAARGFRDAVGHRLARLGGRRRLGRTPSPTAGATPRTTSGTTPTRTMRRVGTGGRTRTTTST